MPVSPTDGQLDFQLNNIRYDKFLNRFYLFGRTESGASVLVRVYNPSFYFYIENPRITDEAECTLRELQAKMSSLNIDLAAALEKRKKYQDQTTLLSAHAELEFVHKRSFMHYHPELSRYVKVTYHQTDVLNELVKQLEVYFESLQYYEKTIPPLTFFHRDRQIWMNGWASAQGQSLEAVPLASRESTCDLEYNVNFDDISGFNPNFGKSVDPKWETVAPYRTLSVDMEMLGRDGKFPIPEQDAIITICAYANTESAEKVREMVRKPGTKRDVGPLNSPVDDGNWTSQLRRGCRVLHRKDSSNCTGTLLAPRIAKHSKIAQKRGSGSSKRRGERWQLQFDLYGCYTTLESISLFMSRMDRLHWYTQSEGYMPQQEALHIAREHFGTT
jgi:DNA polymerase elongation subunit (family B)